MNNDEITKFLNTPMYGYNDRRTVGEFARTVDLIGIINFLSYGNTFPIECKKIIYNIFKYENTYYDPTYLIMKLNPDAISIYDPDIYDYFSAEKFLDMARNHYSFDASIVERFRYLFTDDDLSLLIYYGCPEAIKWMKKPVHGDIIEAASYLVNNPELIFKYDVFKSFSSEELCQLFRNSVGIIKYWDRDANINNRVLKVIRRQLLCLNFDILQIPYKIINVEFLLEYIDRANFNIKIFENAITKDEKILGRFNTSELRSIFLAILKETNDLDFVKKYLEPLSKEPDFEQISSIEILDIINSAIRNETGVDFAMMLLDFLLNFNKDWSIDDSVILLLISFSNCNSGIIAKVSAVKQEFKKRLFSILTNKTTYRKFVDEYAKKVSPSLNDLKRRSEYTILTITILKSNLFSGFSAADIKAILHTFIETGYKKYDTQSITTILTGKDISKKGFLKILEVINPLKIPDLCIENLNLLDTKQQESIALKIIKDKPNRILEIPEPTDEMIMIALEQCFTWASERYSDGRFKLKDPNRLIELITNQKEYNSQELNNILMQHSLDEFSPEFILALELKYKVKQTLMIERN